MSPILRPRTPVEGGSITDPITITTDSLPSGGTGEEYSQTLTATGTVTSWAVTSGDLPAELTLDTTTGTISGTISGTAAGDSDALSYTFDVTASNSSTSAVKTFTLLIYKSITVLTETLPNATVGTEYSASIEASGGHVTAWVLKPAANVPEWLKYSNNNNILSIWGTPTTTGTYTFISDCGNVYCGCQKTFTLTVDPKPAPALKPKISIPKGRSLYLAGQTYSIKPTVTGTAPITWAVTGTLPPGFTFDTSTGEIGGTLTAADEGKYAFVHMPYTFTVSAANRAGTDSAEIFIPVYYPADIITDSTLPPATKNASYSTEITAEGTEFSMNWKKTDGNLPRGLTLSMNKGRRTCSITGSPAETGTFTFTLKLSNIAGFAETQKTFTLTVNDDSDTETGKPEITTETLQDGETGTAYVAVLEAAGQKPITWSKSGSFPKGLKLDKYGTIIGVPSKAGTYTFTVKAKNRKGTVSKKFTVTVTGDEYKKPKITTKAIPAASVNQAYSFQLSAAGTNTDSCPITWSLVGNKYPSGMYLTEDGLLTGIPKEAGKFTVKVKAENNMGSATKSYSIKVSGLKPEIVNENLPAGITGLAYTSQLLADGSDPITWSKSGKFPSGLKLAPKTGEITGTPKKAGTYSFTVTAKNKYGKDTRDFVIVVGTVSDSDETSEPEETITGTPSAFTDSAGTLPEITQDDSQPETYGHETELDMWVVSGDEELRGEIYVPEGRPVTFMIASWPGGFDDAEVYIADEALALEVADDGTFTLPGELVSDEFVIYVMAGNTKTIELYIVAEQED